MVSEGLIKPCNIVIRIVNAKMYSFVGKWRYKT